MRSATTTSASPGTGRGSGAAPAETVPARAGARQWLALVVLVLPTLVVAANGTVLTFALPTLSVALSPTATQLLWVVDVYPLVLAGLLVAMGSLGDRIGRRRMLMVGAAGFAVVSVAAALAPTAGALVAARAVLGLFGAMLMPPTMALLRTVFPDAGQRRLAVAVWATGFSAGAAVGPIAGAVLLERFWWGSALLVAVPVCLALLVAAPLLLPESRDAAPGPVDLVSVALSMLTTAPFVYAVKAFATEGLGLAAGGAMAVAAVSGCVFVRRQLRSASPLLDLDLFRSRVFSASVAANLLGVSAFAGLLLIVSQHLQLVVGLAPLPAALLLLPSTAATIGMGLLSVRLARSSPLHVLVPAGLGLAAAGYGVATQLSGAPTAGLLVLAAVLVGGGMGLAETLTNDAILSAAPADRVGAASAVSETAYELGAVLGTAVLGSVLAAVYRGALVVPDGIAPAGAAAATETLGSAVDVAQRSGEPGRALLAAAHEAFATGVDATAAVGAGVVLLAAGMVAVALRPRR